MLRTCKVLAAGQGAAMTAYARPGNPLPVSAGGQIHPMAPEGSRQPVPVAHGPNLKESHIVQRIHERQSKHVQLHDGSRGVR